ncbi:unnamed protein product [Bursaphelenchus xylophilus]|uniref:(pine wood nematode) hypothetical protein n=1 Tax=Bursaphelenchus xylophilus TaxID=6326 RepID=A0A7I8XH44_BURXY|nr:unnamed protein product [Bursaphelenchus xylophilus]CAG9081163.1 unnamed protein product [Bursaphelenchus xylophilus]
MSLRIQDFLRTNCTCPNNFDCYRPFGYLEPLICLDSNYNVGKTLDENCFLNFSIKFWPLASLLLGIVAFFFTLLILICSGLIGVRVNKCCQCRSKVIEEIDINE